MSNYSIATSMYARALRTFSTKAGRTSRVDAGIEEHLASSAEALALPSSGTSQTESPVLRSVVGHLYGQNHSGYYRLQTIQNEAALPTSDIPVISEETYQQLWTGIESELNRIQTSEINPKVYEANLHALLHRYTWAMSVPISGADDISLYDFTRVSAALAVCLSDNRSTTENRAVLIGGDISGVQDWLYSFSSSGAAKTLRGRSFYLQLLAEVIALFVLEYLHLPMANLLYVGGGNFYVIAPPSSVDALMDLQKEISRKLLAMHDGGLYVAIAHVSLTDSLLTNDVGRAWDSVSKRLNRFKARRFAELDDDEMSEAIGSPSGESGDPRNVCGICGRNIGHGEKTKPIEGGRRRKCGLCVTFEELGTALAKASYLALSRVQPGKAEDVADWHDGLRQFGYDVQLLRSANDREANDWEDVSSDFVRIYFWQDEPEVQDFPGWPGDERTVWAFRPMAQCVPFKDDSGQEIATFDELTSEGIARWGVLRMDVDNLGDIFQHGIPANNLSRVVGLSGMMRLYFEGHVPLLAQKYNQDACGKRRPRMYLMYAGGDDLFVVGGWSDLPGLAADIRNDFVKFACGNPKCTISAGISIALGKKYPLYQAARDAGRAEHLAKHWREPMKDSIAILGEPLGWGQTYDDVEKRVRDLSRWVSRGSNVGGKLPSSFLMTLRQLDAEWREWKKQESGERRTLGIEPRYRHEKTELYLGPWQWRLLYALVRAAERSKDDDLRQEIDQLIISLLQDEIKTIGLSSRWAELLTRKSGV